jgi:hypothetical protein
VTAWFLNRALTAMRAEVNARYPNRDKTSDGTIGDVAHQAGVSDHNPDPDGSVDAWDMDVDLRSGGDTAAVEFLKQRFQAHPAALYWIHNRQIASRSDGWVRWNYQGANPHDKHVHWNTRGSHETSDQPWGIKEDDMPLTAEDIEKVALATARAVHNQRIGASQTTIGQAVQATHGYAAGLDAKMDAVYEAVLGVDEEVVSKLGSPGLTAEQIADLLRPVLGGRAQAVGAALAAPQ